jgi:SNF2 family DNA or RNA helicase
MLRLQQVLCGYVPVDDDDPRNPHLLGNSNPRIDLTVEIAQELGHPAIIWSRFTRDIDLICERLGDRAVRYDGKIDNDECERNKLAFQAGDKQFFVANQQKGSTGLTLHVAKTVIYHANSFKLIERLQSEDRAHRAGMDDNPVNYIDILGERDGTPTLDLRTIEALRAKFDIASQITGDQLREWI